MLQQIPISWQRTYSRDELAYRIYRISSFIPEKHNHVFHIPVATGGLNTDIAKLYYKILLLNIVVNLWRFLDMSPELCKFIQDVSSINTVLKFPQSSSIYNTLPSVETWKETIFRIF